jgi:beta-lactamase regulating signal transducer with metallopeptidase domain
MDAEILSALVRANIAGGLAVLLVLALRSPCQRMLGAGATYGLWLIPPLAMAASLLPGPTWDISFPIPVPGGSPGPEAIPAPAAMPLPWAAGAWIIGAWALGIAASALLIAIRQRQFMAALGKPELDADGLPIMRARDGFAVGPAVIGTLSPRIVLPADFETRYSAEERRVILAHERVHLFGHDAQANAVAALLQCLCWFNPLAHVAAYFFRIDQELNADAEVVRQFPEHQRAYAEALLKTQIASRSLILGCQWPARSEHPLKVRISLLSLRAQVPRLGGITIAGVALFAGLIAWAGSPRIMPAPEGESVVIWTMLKSERSQPDKARRMLAAQGSWSDVSYQLPDGERYRVSLNPVRLPDRVEVRVRVEHDGAVTELTPLKLDSAEPGLVHLDRLTVLVTVGEKLT